MWARSIIIIIIVVTYKDVDRLLNHKIKLVPTKFSGYTKYWMWGTVIDNTIYYYNCKYCLGHGLSNLHGGNCKTGSEIKTELCLG